MNNFCSIVIGAVLAMTLVPCAAIAEVPVQTVSVEIPAAEQPSQEYGDLTLEVMTEGQGCVWYSQNNADPGRLQGITGTIVQWGSLIDLEFNSSPGWHIAQVIYNDKDITEQVINSELNRIEVEGSLNGNVLYARYEQDPVEELPPVEEPPMEEPTIEEVPPTPVEEVPPDEEPQEVEDGLPQTGDKTPLPILIPIMVEAAAMCVIVAAVVFRNRVNSD